ncbi:hypothetical protein AMTR_s00085p00167710 [Amborella trichopoda]|uniref:Retrotransposon gag domain-containing protein n=1 Tax=Amborella trichopoda TaxID=13333 RepID=W1P519_AMBTC|nr:hypothetical protein AMTR_s00085p00167710 [Amborella trichopoda]
MVGSIIDSDVIAQVIIQAMGNPSLRHVANHSAQPDPKKVPRRPFLEPSYQFYHPQPREAPPVPMALGYPLVHQPTPIYLATQHATLRNSLGCTEAKYLFLEGYVKTMRGALQRLGVDDLALMESNDKSYLEGLTDLPINFLPPYFRNRCNGKDDPQLRVTSYLLVIPTLCDKPVALKAMFVHSLAGDTITWYNDFVRDYPDSSYREMFDRLVTHHCTKQPRPISLRELVAFKQGPDELFTDFFDGFNAMAVRHKMFPIRLSQDQYDTRSY